MDIIDYNIQIVNMHENEHCKCAKYIKDQFESKYGGTWCVFLKPQNYSSSSVTRYDNGYIDFTIGEFNIIIFKSHE